MLYGLTCFMFLIEFTKDTVSEQLKGRPAHLVPLRVTPKSPPERRNGQQWLENRTLYYGKKKNL